MWPFASYPELSAADVDGKTFDYVIVGGGTAGCVLASRLSQDPSVTVAVLEKGFVRDNFWTRIPLLSSNFHFPGMQSVLRHSEPVAAFDGLKLQLWTAEALGGASRVNGMLLTRGVPGGYNFWAESLGLKEWSWEKVEPYFKRSENAVGRPGRRHRGHDGPIENRPAGVVLGSIEHVNEAARRVGLPIQSDANDPAASAQGCFDLDQTVDSKGMRLSAYRAWLPPGVARERRGRLAVCTGVIASKLVLDEDASRVEGVRIRSVRPGAGTGEYVVKARREVIVCSGAICTPQLLMLSGIGPKDQLEAQGIPVRREMDAVGRNLSDHTAATVMMEIERKDTFYVLETLVGFLWNFLLWLFLGKGLLAYSSTPKSIFYRTDAVDEDTMTIRHRDAEGNDTMDASLPRNIPNIEIMVIPTSSLMTPVSGLNLFSWYTTLVQPFSRGRVELASADPAANPRVLYPMMTDERDRAAIRTALRFSMHLAEEFGEVYPRPAPITFAPGMDLKYLEGWYAEKPVQKPIPIVPAPVGEPARSVSAPKGVLRQQQNYLGGKTWRDVTDGDIDEYVKRAGASCLHYTSTCRMSLDPNEGVVDQRLRVHGMENLRIADASIFPYLPSGHTMAPVVMFAERCADFLREDWADRKGK